MSYNPIKINQFPLLPGVYLMMGENGEVLYVGKAKNLKARVKQYFIPGRDGRVMIPYLVEKVEDIHTIVVSSEKEALLLENNLIKKHEPRYNALLKDDKTYIAIKITHKDEWPTVQLVRYKGEPEPNALYFGPYTSAHAARDTYELLMRLFPLRDSSMQGTKRFNRPCLLCQIRGKLGACCAQYTHEEYRKHVERAIKFLKGQDKEIIRELYGEMERLSEQMEFEKAAKLLVTINHVKKTVESQLVDRPLGGDTDALSIFRCGKDVMIGRLIFRKGKLISSRLFPFHDIAENNQELLTSFLMQHYETEEAPKEILLPFIFEDIPAIEEILETNSKHRVSLLVPQKGDKRALLEMAYTNAEAMYKIEHSEQSIKQKVLTEMQELFRLKNYPEKIECFDNSHISGSDSVAACVAFNQGVKDTSHYRLYKLRQTEKSDDYGAMREVLTRRYNKAKEMDDLPDLIIVDGGKGQLNIALAVLEELSIDSIDIIGLAKEESRHDKGMRIDKVFLPDSQKPVFLEPKSAVLFLLQRIRDEAHRFAITFHRKRRSKGVVKSVLDEISGIGPAKRKALLKHFGGIQKVKEAGIEELREVKGISLKNAQSIYDHLRQK